jgi:hypothetical protein
VALLAAAALVAAATRLPDSVRASHARIAETAELSSLERELYPTRVYGLNAGLLLRADEVLPGDAVFNVTAGPGMLSGHLLAAPFSAYWLLPRRYTADPQRADWILSFGTDPATVGVEVEVVEDLGIEGQRLLRVRR